VGDEQCEAGVLIPDVPSKADHCAEDGTKPKRGVLEQWPLFLEALQRERPMLGHYLRVASVASLSESAIDVRFPGNCSAQYAELIKNKNREEINRIMKEIVGRRLTFTLPWKRAAGGGAGGKKLFVNK